MITSDFLDVLARHPAAELRFATDEGTVAPGYHVTEFKATTVRAVDCGGAATSWGETVLQVVPPAGPAADSMAVEKFLAIYQRVAGAVVIEGDAQVRVETAAPGARAVSYLADGVDVAEGAVTVRLVAPAVACKGADRSVGDIPMLSTTGGGGACCAPTSAGASAPTTACCA